MCPLWASVNYYFARRGFYLTMGRRFPLRRVPGVGISPSMQLKEYLAGAGLTIDAFAESVGASPGMIHKIVYRTRQPSLTLAAEIERASEGKVGALDMLLTPLAASTPDRAAA